MKEEELERINTDHEKEVDSLYLKGVNPEVREELTLQLEELELVRQRYLKKRIRNKRIGIGLVILLLINMLSFFFTIDLFTFNQLGIQFVSLLVLVVCIIPFNNDFSNAFKRHFKFSVMESLVQLFFSDLKYFPRQKMSENSFKKSQLIQAFDAEKHSLIEGEDYFQGKFKGYTFEFSETAIYEPIHEKTTSGERWYTNLIFNGLLMRIELPDLEPTGFWGIAAPKYKDCLIEHRNSDSPAIIDYGVNDKIKNIEYRQLEGSVEIPQVWVEAVQAFSREQEAPVWVTYVNGDLYLAISSSHSYDNKWYNNTFVNKDGGHQVSHSNSTAYTQMKLFSPPILEQPIKDSSVIQNTIKELQSCLDIVDSFVDIVNSTE